MTDTFKEIGSLFGREGAGAGFAKQTDKESFTYAFAWPEGDTWATLTGYLNLDEQPEEYVRRVLQDGGFRSDWDNPDYDPIGDFKETADDEYRIPLLKVLLREQLESRYEVANHFSTMNRARVELSAFIQNEGGAPLPEDALGTPEEQGIRAMLIAALRPGANAVSGGRCVPGTIVCSVYGKPESYFLHKMQQMPQRVLYQDIEKGRELDARAKLQLFGGNIASPDLDRKIIRLPECIVKLQAGSAPTEAARVQQESRDMASGSHALGAARPAFGTPAMNRPIDSNLE